ncbi:MAG: hypothetical protein ACOYXS_01095 [Chloroflexota bacterium]
MHGLTKKVQASTRQPTSRSTLAHPSGAVTWIDSTRAIVARTGRNGRISVSVIRPDPELVEERIPFLSQVVDEIGDRDRVVIMGPDAMRVELEREYVTIFQRPDRIVDVETSGPTEQTELVRRLELLTSG